jgi:UDP-N-acetyl-D-galactosamine dehydrogenase
MEFLPFAGRSVVIVSVDPYYLAQKAQELGYHPEIILAGRRLNDSMGNMYSQIVKLMIKESFS